MTLSLLSVHTSHLFSFLVQAHPLNHRIESPNFQFIVDSWSDRVHVMTGNHAYDLHHYELGFRSSHFNSIPIPDGSVFGTSCVQIQMLPRGFTLEQQK